MESHHTIDEKIRIIVEYANSDIAPEELCRRHGLSLELFNRWREQFVKGGGAGLIGECERKKLGRRIARLERKAEELAIANRALKETLEQGAQNGDRGAP